MKILCTPIEMDKIIVARMYTKMSQKEKRLYKEGMCNKHKMASPQFDELMKRAVGLMVQWDLRPNWQKSLSWLYYKFIWSAKVHANEVLGRKQVK